MSAKVLLAAYAREEDVLSATRAARAAGYEIVDVYTPYAVHGLDAAQGLAPSRLTWACFACGLLGGLGMLAFMFWTSAADWPLNVGGKPFNSLPAFVPVWFELTVLSASLGVVAALLVRCGLFPGRRARLVHPRVTDDRFVLVLKADGAGFDAARARALLAAHGAAELRLCLEDDLGADTTAGPAPVFERIPR